MKKSFLNNIGFTINDIYNNMPADRIPNSSSEWALTDISAADSKIPPPHHGSYNVLFFDGHGKTVKTITLKPR
jgi:prepilin-type processing-associated H-X9-DG protein